jgi:dipeptidyl-peptidase-4
MVSGHASGVAGERVDGGVENWKTHSREHRSPPGLGATAAFRAGETSPTVHSPIAAIVSRRQNAPIEVIGLVPSSISSHRVEVLMKPSQLAEPPESLGHEPVRVSATVVAKLPYPGLAVPGAFSFTRDGRVLTYLKSESFSLDQVLWRVLVPAGTQRVVVRPSEGGDAEESLSDIEKLRRERKRFIETGLTQVVRAEDADVAVITLQGNLYLQREDGPLERITNSQSPAIDATLSANGAKVAFVRDNELYVIDLVSGRETALSRGAGEGLSHGLAEYIAQEEMGRAVGYWWSPDGERIAYQETDERHVPVYPIVHQGAERLSVETHRYPFAGMANAIVRLGVSLARGGETRWLTYCDPAEDVYLARVTWDTTRSLLVQVLTRDQRCLRLWRIDVDTGARELLIEERSDTWINLHNDLFALKMTGEFVWSSERAGFRHLELRDRDGCLIRRLTEGDWPVDAVAAVDPERREVWFTGRRERPLQVSAYRVSLEGGPVERITHESGIHRVWVARTCNHFVDMYSSSTIPPRTSLCDRTGKILTSLDDASCDPNLRELNVVPPTLERFQSRDGVSLYGAYYAPKSKHLEVDGKVPLIVKVYGGPHVQTVSESWSVTADMTAQFLSELGFAVWKTDNRGSAHRGHSFEAAVHRQLGSVEVRDQADGVRHITSSRPEVDIRRVGIMGGSFGGYMTLRALADAPDIFRAGVAISPVTDWCLYDTCYTERYMGIPAENHEGYHRSSVLASAFQITGALLIIHGMLDENVHFRHSARLVTCLLEAEKQFAFLPLPDERHSSRREADRKYVAERIADFFRQALKPS